MFKVSDLGGFHDEEVYNDNIYYCDYCDAENQAAEVPALHCFTCKSDLCPKCCKNELEYDICCESEHRLHKISNPAFFGEDDLSSDTSYTCSKCSKYFVDVAKNPTFYCNLCDYHLCCQCGETLKLAKKTNSKMVCQPKQGQREEIQEEKKCDATEVRSLEENNKNKEIMNQFTCVVCLTKQRNHIFMPCMHMCTCEECALKVFIEQKGCPICRTQLQQIAKVFIT